MSRALRASQRASPILHPFLFPLLKVLELLLKKVLELSPIMMPNPVNHLPVKQSTTCRRTTNNDCSPVLLACKSQPTISTCAPRVSELVEDFP
jgi:hypothetical protein